MFYKLKVVLLIFIAPMIVLSCSKDDDNDGTLNPIGGSGGSSEQLTSGFEISGGLSGTYNGDNTVISVNQASEDGTTINIETTSPDDGSTFWNLTFGASEGDVENLVPGDYSLGNIDDFTDGNADLLVSFQVHPAGNNLPLMWGMTAPTSGTLTITEVEYGAFDNGTRDRVTGTFEFTASDAYSGLAEEEDLQDPIVVTDGEFIGKMLVIQ